MLASVAAWREAKAQELDKPRRRLLKDDAIHEIADQKPKSPEEFDRLRAVPNGFIRSKNANGLSAAVANALDDPSAHAPNLPPKKTNPQTPAGAPEMLKVLLKHVSEEADVVPRLIANAADIEAIARGDREGIAAFEGWRRDVFGERAAALMNGKLALSFEDGAVRLFEV